MVRGMWFICYRPHVQQRSSPGVTEP